MKKLLIFLFTSFLICSVLSGCSQIDKYVKQPELVYDTQYPATKVEYNNIINAQIVGIENIMETHIENSHNIVYGRYLPEYERDVLSTSIASVDDYILQAQAVYPPKGVETQHAKYIQTLKQCRNALKVYSDTIKDAYDISTSKELIENCNGIMVEESSNLKTYFSIM